MILGNTLDNALEACQLLPEDRRWLHIKLRYRGKTFFTRQKTRKWPVHRQKKAGSRHGYGLKNIRRSVKKYSGQVIIEETDERYILTIRMNG